MAKGRSARHTSFSPLIVALRITQGAIQKRMQGVANGIDVVARIGLEQTLSYQLNVTVKGGVICFPVGPKKFSVYIPGPFSVIPHNPS